jgi:hypothetical protein
MLMTCRAGDDPLSVVHAASADDAADTALPDPARSVTPVGTPRCKNAGTPVPAARRTPRSNRADRTSVRKNLRRPWLGAGPRTPLTRQLTPRQPLLKLPVLCVAADNADLAPADVPAPGLLPASAGSPGIVATAAPLADMPRCNSGSAAATADTSARSPSIDNAAVGHDNRLELGPTNVDTEVGPRERELPGSSLEEEFGAPLRGVLIGASGCDPQLNPDAERWPEQAANHVRTNRHPSPAQGRLGTAINAPRPGPLLAAEMGHPATAVNKGETRTRFAVPAHREA